MSKVYMAKFHYGWVVPKYPRYKLLFSDTDSFAYHIYTRDIYRDMWESKHLFDFSNYSTTSNFYSNENNKKIGAFKDEMPTSAIQEWVGLRPKMYSIKADDRSTKF